MTKSSSHSIIREIAPRKAQRSSSDVRQYPEKRLSRGSTSSFHEISAMRPIITANSRSARSSSSSDNLVFNKSISVPSQEHHYGKALMADDNIDPIKEYHNTPLNDPHNNNNNITLQQSPSQNTLEGNVRVRHHEQLAQQQTTNVNTLRSGKLRHRRSLDQEHAAIHREHLRERGHSTTERNYFNKIEHVQIDDSRDPQYV